MFGNHFNHNTIRIYNAVFGGLFNDIEILRDDGKRIPVPISYGAGAKYFLLKRDNPDNQREVSITLPRMSYKLEALNHDISRQGNKSQELQNNATYQYNRVPYDFIYTLSIKTKTVDDGHQIIEQILPYFTPILNVKIQDSSDLGIVSTIPIRLDSTTPIDNFEGSMEDTRELEWDLSFNLKGWLYNRSKVGVQIKEVIINLDDYMKNFQTNTYAVNPSSANIDDEYVIDETITENI